MISMDSNPGAATSFDIEDATSSGRSNTDFTNTAVSLGGGALLFGNIMTQLKAVINNSVNDNNTETISNQNYLLWMVKLQF